MSIEKFQYRYLYPHVSAVRWTGGNQKEILEFIREICVCDLIAAPKVSNLIWGEEPEEVIHFVEYGDSKLMIEFDNGLEVDEGEWIVCFRNIRAEWLEVLEDDEFWAAFGRGGFQ